MINKDAIMELTRGDVKIAWVDLNEGFNGDYNPDDPDDEHLLRFDVYVRRQVSPESWELACTYCTYFPADASDSEKSAALEILMNMLHESAEKYLHTGARGDLEIKAMVASYISREDVIGPTTKVGGL